MEVKIKGSLHLTQLALGFVKYKELAADTASSHLAALALKDLELEKQDAYYQ